MTDAKDRLVRIVREAADKPADQPPAAVRIQGSHNIVGNGNTVIHTQKITHRPVTPPPPGSITPAQAQTIRQLIHEWKAVHDRIKTYPLSWGAAWEMFKKKFRINSYLSLPAERFDEAVAWLRKKRAMLDGMKTASRKDPAWRSRQITYIKARCKNQLGDPECYKHYIKRRFGKSSLAALTDEELAATRSYIAHKKPT